MTGALEGMVVLDLTHYVAGPFCTKLLADYGAEVIKVERPDGGDPARYIGPFFHDDPHPEKSGLFLHLNTNKKSITLNLKTPTGIRLFKELVLQADVVVENFAPRVIPSLGLDYATLETIKPSLVFTSISNFGQEGPYRDYQATEIVLFALSQLMYITGEPDREPLRFAGYQAQYHGGLNAAVGTLGAYLHSKFTGEGQRVDVSLWECLVGITERQFLRYPYRGDIRRRTGQLGEMFPWTVYPCKDGYVAAFGANYLQWRGACEMMGRPDLAGPEFQTNQQRLQRRDELETVMLPWLLERTEEEIFHAAQSCRAPWVPVYTAADLLRDEHFEERQFFVEIDHPVVGTLVYPGAPFKLSETPWQARRAAPLLGEHNVEVFCDRLGYSKADLVRLHTSGVM